MGLIRESKTRPGCYKFTKNGFHFMFNDSAVVAAPTNGERSSLISLFKFRWKVINEEIMDIRASEMIDFVDGFLNTRRSRSERFDLLDAVMGFYYACEKDGLVMQIKPSWAHDLEDSIFLTSVAEDGREVDLYVRLVKGSPYPQLIVRYGDDPEDFRSGFAFGAFGFDFELQNVYIAAQKVGLLEGVPRARINLLDHGDGVGMGMPSCFKSKGVL